MSRITSHRRRAALEADRRKSEFLAMLAHELRNPLAALTVPAGPAARALLAEPEERGT